MEHIWLNFFSKYKLNLKLKKLSKERWQTALLTHEVWEWALVAPGKAGAEVKYEEEGVKAELSRTTDWSRGRAPGQREDTTRVQGKGYDPTFISRQTVTLTGRDEKPRANRPTEKLIQQTRPDAIQQPGLWESGGIKRRGTFNVIQWDTTAEKVYYMLETMLEIHS